MLVSVSRVGQRVNHVGAGVQLRVEIQYRQPLSLPVSVEVHAINDAAHSKIATWLPEADKMHAELEGNRMSRTLNASSLPTPPLSLPRPSYPPQL